MDLLRHKTPLTHEAIAAHAGAGARTVYRYFPSQADLFQAVWERLAGPAAFPLLASEIVEMASQAFERFDQHEAVVRAVPPEVWNREGADARAAFEKSLAYLTDDPKVLAVFAALGSAPFWKLLRDGRGGGLSGPDARAALTWTLETLLAALQKAALPRRRAES